MQRIEGRLSMSGRRDYTRGRLAEACRAADEALMNVLVIANINDLGASPGDIRGVDAS